MMRKQNSMFFLNSTMRVFTICFIFGLISVLFKRQIFLLTLLSIEAMYLALICLLALSTNIFAYGQIFALSFLVIAACESAIGLGILIISYRFGSSLNFADYEELKG